MGLSFPLCVWEREKEAYMKRVGSVRRVVWEGWSGDVYCRLLNWNASTDRVQVYSLTQSATCVVFHV
jgi:hypothetical protein